MTFRECRYLDLSRMDSNRLGRELIGGRTLSAHTDFHPCLSEKNPDDWVSECPEDCPYFEPKTSE